MTATTVKYSPKMLRELRSLYAPTTGAEGIKGSYWINANTAVALLSRGAIVNISSVRIGLNRTGAEAIDVDYDALVDRAHEQALKDNANRRVCPFAVDGCDFVAFGSPGTPYGHYRDITSDDQILYHVNKSHTPSRDAYWLASITYLDDSVRAGIRQWLADHHPVAPAGPDRRIVDVAEAHDTAKHEYIERAQGMPGEHSLMTAMPERPKYEVDLPVETQACGHEKTHGAHVWSYFGKPLWYCEGVKPDEHDEPATVDEDVAHEVARNEVGMREVVDEYPSLFEGAPPIRTYADGSQEYGPYPPINWSSA